MKIKLASIESNFFKSFMLDKNYDDILDMLKTIDMLSDTDTDTNLSGTNKSTGSNNRTDNLITTKSSRNDTKNDTVNNTENIGARSDTRDTVNGGDTTRTTTYGQDKRTDTTEFGKVDTQTGGSTTDTNGTINDKSRTVVSNTPQSNITTQVAGIDANLDWNYASGLQDNKNNRTNTEKQTVQNNSTNTQSGSDTLISTRQQREDSEITADNRTTSETLDSGEQTNTNSGTSNSSYTEGEQSITNTGTQNTELTENREHSQTGKYKKVNDNSGRTDNLASIRQQWRDLLHRTMSAYDYLFKELDSLFISIWDIEDDCFFDII